MPHMLYHHVFSCHSSMEQTTAARSSALCRRFTHRGSALNLAAGVTALGASATGFYNVLFRFPDIPDLLHSPWFLGYVAVAFFVGASATYYYCDEHDAKLVDILCAALRIVGALMVLYALSQLWELAVGVTAALCIGVIAAGRRGGRRGPPLLTDGGALRFTCPPKLGVVALS